MFRRNKTQAIPAAQPVVRTEPPRIPDHEVLRCIGRGSYGEVWLARSVTGAMRAVKVVRREDFELDRTFEREFEGIRKYEPVSRNCASLVQVLHVGRNDEEGFYYYVMELGDDREKGTDVNPWEYEPRTMGTDRNTRRRLSIGECIEHGIALAEGLTHLHENGLAHRDIKPSNIIFVNGRAKLADIGLVAAAGQQTFVGTEGFVPPEGPGTALADIYSLGMVLYEMSTGNDRLQFPEWPADLGDEDSKHAFRALNDVICKACAPAAKKRHPNAKALVHALRSVRRRRSTGMRVVRRLITVPLYSAVLAFGLVTWKHHGRIPWPPGRFHEMPDEDILTGRVKVDSIPSGADVIWQGDVKGQTPCTVRLPEGTHVLTLRRAQYRPAELTVTSLRAGDEVSPEPVTLSFDDPPRPGALWKNHLGMNFEPAGADSHKSRLPVAYDDFKSVAGPYYEGSVRRAQFPGGTELSVSLVTMDEARRFCTELTALEQSLGFLTSDLCYRPEPMEVNLAGSTPVDKKQSAFRLVVERYATLTIETTPPGALVYGPGVEALGSTPWTRQVVPGDYHFDLRLDGYLQAEAEGSLKSGEVRTAPVVLRESLLAVFGRPWKNSLGMPFVPLGNDLLVCAWETRLRDWKAYAAAKGQPDGIIDTNNDQKDDLGREDNHPAVMISRDQANAFCQWLTEKERAEGLLDTGKEVRLLTDEEWSRAAGIEERRPTPAERDGKQDGIYPWEPDFLYPPRHPADGAPLANLGDLRWAKTPQGLNPDTLKALETMKFDDGYPFTSPVGIFPPNRLGIYDLAGNAAEFVADNYGGTAKGSATKAVIRGGSWATSVTLTRELNTSFRGVVNPDARESNYGFRIAVARVPAG